ncbi:MAG: hypothetical protein ACE5RN_04440 [Nitrosopumilaceae archaeon]
MATEILDVQNFSSVKIGNLLKEFKIKCGKFGTFLFSSSNPMTIGEKVGLIFTIIALGAIITPFALSDSDPYYLKGIIEEVKDKVPIFDNLDNNQDQSQYRIIAHLKLSPEFHLEPTEKIILGKVSPKKL